MEKPREDGRGTGSGKGSGYKDKGKARAMGFVSAGGELEWVGALQFVSTSRRWNQNEALDLIFTFSLLIWLLCGRTGEKAYEPSRPQPPPSNSTRSAPTKVASAFGEDEDEAEVSILSRLPALAISSKPWDSIRSRERLMSLLFIFATLLTSAFETCS